MQKALAGFTCRQTVVGDLSKPAQSTGRQGNDGVRISGEDPLTELGVETGLLCEGSEVVSFCYGPAKTPGQSCPGEWRGYDWLCVVPMLRESDPRPQEWNSKTDGIIIIIDAVGKGGGVDRRPEAEDAAIGGSAGATSRPSHGH